MSNKNIPNLVYRYMYPIKDKEDIQPIYKLFSELKLLSFKDLFQYVVKTPRCNLFNNILSDSQLDRLLLNICKQTQQFENMSSILLKSLKTGQTIWLYSKRFSSFQLVTVNVIVHFANKTFINCSIKKGNRILKVNIDIDNPYILPNVHTQHVLSGYIEAKKNIIDYFYRENQHKKRFCAITALSLILESFM